MTTLKVKQVYIILKIGKKLKKFVKVFPKEYKRALVEMNVKGKTAGGGIKMGNPTGFINIDRRRRGHWSPVKIKELQRILPRLSDYEAGR